MFVADLRQLLLRRWYFVLVGVLLAGAAARAATVVVPATYEARASVLLLPPASSVPAGGNPYLVLGGLSATADVVAKALGADATRQRLRSSGLPGDFEVGGDATTSGPVLLITATARTGDAALVVLRAVTQQVNGTLVELQRATEVRPTSYVTSQVIQTSQKALPVRKSEVRAVVLAIALSLGGALACTVFLDGFFDRRAAARFDRRMVAPVYAALHLSQQDKPLGRASGTG